MRLSIIIPVYQVERYIRTCLESVLQQGLEEHDFEVILIDDGTQDSSFNVIADLIETHSNNITVIHQQNLGLSAGRNKGMELAQGDYIMFVDSDDLLVENSLSIMLPIITKANPDMFIAGFTKMDDEEVERRQHNSQAFRYIEKTGAQAFMENMDPKQCFVWRTIYKRRFLQENSIRFIPGTYFEDIPFTTECYLKAQKCIITDFTFYIYRQHASSILSTINKRKIMDFHGILAKLWDMRETMELTGLEKNKLMEVIFTTFSIEIWFITHDKQLVAERRDITNDFKQRVPNVHFGTGIKEKFIYLIYRIMPNTYIKIRSLFY